MSYDHKKIEKKWQNIWEEKKVFVSSSDQKKQKYYVLEMFPYPSGKLHVGHLRNYAIGDVIARFKLMQGYNVLHPMGWDAFGLPAENAAICQKVSPDNWTWDNIDTMKNQMKKIGFSYDWNREFTTCAPSHYKHQQKLFLDLLKTGIIYKKKSLVNWDPVDNTVLANEQVINGRGWRSGAKVHRKSLSQWFFKITKYQDKLLEDIKKLDKWPKEVKLMQEKWIGKLDGLLVKFKLDKVNGNMPLFIEVFVHKCQDLLDCNFLSLSPENSFVTEHFSNNHEVKDFISNEIDCALDDNKGVKLPVNVKHPLFSDVRIPIFVNNLVLRDEEYAKCGFYFLDSKDKKFMEHNKIQQLNIPKYLSQDLRHHLPQLNDLKYYLEQNNLEDEIISYLNKFVKKVSLYRLKDWNISRQRFWGCPIPIIYCKNCGEVPLEEKHLPVKLPSFSYSNSRENYLKLHPEWKYVKCHKCYGDAIRETDTFDTFFESSWYFLRFCNPNISDKIFDSKECNYWMNVDVYVGGVEHAILHLLYARFMTKIINDLDYGINAEEPFSKLITQGMVLHHVFTDEEGNFVYPNDVEEKNGMLFHKSSGRTVLKSSQIEKMSKSKKNIVDLDFMLDKYGSDASRLFLLSDSPTQRNIEWSHLGIEASKRFIVKLKLMCENIFILAEKKPVIKENVDIILEKILNMTILKVTKFIEEDKLNNAISSLRILYNQIEKRLKIGSYTYTLSKSFSDLIKMFNPFIPHITEEIWNIIKKKEDAILAQQSWPVVNNENNNDLLKKIIVQSNGVFIISFNISTTKNEDIIKKEVLNNDKVKKFLIGKKINKILVIKTKVVNIITNDLS